jgi:hypothetical protein
MITSSKVREFMSAWVATWIKIDHQFKCRFSPLIVRQQKKYLFLNYFFMNKYIFVFIPLLTPSPFHRRVLTLDLLLLVDREGKNNAWIQMVSIFKVTLRTHRHFLNERITSSKVWPILGEINCLSSFKKKN